MSKSVSNQSTSKAKGGVVSRQTWDSAMSQYTQLFKDGHITEEVKNVLISKYASEHRVKGTRGETHLSILAESNPQIMENLKEVDKLLRNIERLAKADGTKLTKLTKGDKPQKKGFPSLRVMVEINS